MDWRESHGKVIHDFLQCLNKQTDAYVLKGGTSLMMCYNLDRFSEDIDLDSTNKSRIKKIVESFCVENGYSYRINKIATMKSSAYAARDKIRDLYDVVFICKNYFSELSDDVKGFIKEVLQYKGLEQFDYLIHTQKDELIDADKLAEDFLDVFDMLGLMVDREQKEEIMENDFEEDEPQERTPKM